MPDQATRSTYESLCKARSELENLLFDVAMRAATAMQTAPAQELPLYAEAVRAYAHVFQAFRRR